MINNSGETDIQRTQRGHRGLEGFSPTLLDFRLIQDIGLILKFKLADKGQLTSDELSRLYGEPVLNRSWPFFTQL
jgi:hypothetical protein